MCEKQATSPVKTYLICPLFSNANFIVTLWLQLHCAPYQIWERGSRTFQFSGLSTVCSLLCAALIHNNFLRAPMTVCLLRYCWSMATLVLPCFSSSSQTENSQHRLCDLLGSPDTIIIQHLHCSTTLSHQNLVMELHWKTKWSMS